MGNLLHIRNLVKRYPGFTLDRIGLAVEEGCVTGLVGSNGVGKTTAIKGRTARAGAPTASRPAGTSRVTRAPAPTTARSPMVTPGRTVKIGRAHV